ncbi:MAG: methyltransferase regulatory domain-containing protein [Bradymonadales bacterium]|nr:methyltransferase regulatory domain-containing protein [Bradymonadales bacterium]
MPSLTTESTTYDELLYPTYAQHQSHPDVLATIGSLFGLSPAPVGSCRVLELGSGSGGNLIPMAYHLPGSSFLGIDLSGRSIEQGRQFIAELGLENIELNHLDLRELTQDAGQFDYILCHGVYSWVDEPVRQSILSICRDHLAPHGVAYVSYNVYPGWYYNQPLRELLRYFARRAPNPTEQARLARILVNWLKTTQTDEKDSRTESLRKEIEHIEVCGDSYLYHEYLIDENRPMYFHQFVEQAAEYDLRYLGDSERETMQVENQQESHARFMQMCSGVIEAQQFLDFFLERRFRYSLLCHAEREISMLVDPVVVQGMWVQASFQTEKPLGDIHDPEPWMLESSGGSRVSITSEPMRWAFAALSQVSPAAIPFDQLAQTIVDHCPDPPLHASDEPGAPSTELLKDLAIQLIHLYFAGIVQLHTYQSDLCPRITDRPMVSCLARLEGQAKQAVTTHWHYSIFPNPVAIDLIQLLDGEHDRGQLIDALLQSGAQFEGKEIWEPYLDRAAREQQVDEFLENLRAEGVLIG